MYDVSRVDVSYCNNEKRHEFLNLLSDSVIYDYIDFSYNRCKNVDNALLWIGSRKVNILSLSTRTTNANGGHLTDNGLVGLTRHCDRIKSLDMFGCKNITDSSVIEISRRLDSVLDFDISYCTNITDTCMIEIARLAGLQSLNFTYCANITDTSVIEVARNMINLKSYEIAWMQ